MSVTAAAVAPVPVAWLFAMRRMFTAPADGAGQAKSLAIDNTPASLTRPDPRSWAWMSCPSPSRWIATSSEANTSRAKMPASPGSRVNITRPTPGKRKPRAVCGRGALMSRVPSCPETPTSPSFIVDSLSCSVYPPDGPGPDDHVNPQPGHEDAEDEVDDRPLPR